MFSANFSRNILILVISLLLSLFLAELYFKVSKKFIKSYPVKLIGWNHLVDPELGWLMKPNQRGKLKSSSFGTIDVVINSKGLRDHEYDYKRDDKDRIVMLGDSQLFGLGVNIEKTVPKILEKKLVNTDVINMGMIGYGTDQEYLFMKREAIKYQPDWAILLYTGNDYWFLDKFYAHAYYYRKPRFTLNKNDLVLNKQMNFGKLNGSVSAIYADIDSLNNFFYFNSYIYKKISEILFQKLLAPSTTRYKNNMELSKVIFLKMNNYLNENNIKFVIVFTDRKNQFETELAKWLEKQGIRTINTNLNQMQKYYIPQDAHLSQEGHQKIAEQILNFFQNKELNF